jgi:hypothetical protein
MWPAALLRVAALRPVMATLAPFLAKSRATAKPMPLLPPVTTATLFSSLFMVSLPVSGRYAGQSFAAALANVRLITYLCQVDTFLSYYNLLVSIADNE